ncbi:MFS transporter [Rummeliibacillus sp. JY-2-4R]
MQKISFNVAAMIDQSKFKGFHGLVLFWCAFIIVFDGYDLVIYGSAISNIMEEWSLNPNQAGSLGSVALIGMMLGALIFGPLADKIGRKNVILFCIALFSLFTGLIVFTHSPFQFGICRFIAGLGLGGVMPNAIALMTEYSPKSLKNTLVSIMFSGYSVGGILAAGLAIAMLGQFGWKSLFLVGAFPLLALPFIYKTLPESPRFLLKKNELEKMGKILTKIDPTFTYHENINFEQMKTKEIGMPVVKLFKNGRALSTIMFWIAFFMCLLMIYGLNTWLPKLMDGAGLSVSSLMFLLVLNVGAIFGAIFGGQLADRWNPKSVLLLFFLLAAISLTLLGWVHNIFLLYVLVAIAGATTIGTQIICNAYISQFYPTEMRSSGLGWALGIGRLGAIAGPLIGGVLLTMKLPFYQNFLIFALPGIIGALALCLVQEKYSGQKVKEWYSEKEMTTEI